MSVTNPNQTVSRQDLKDFYDSIFPYLGGKASAGFTPVGTIISVMGVTAPANYLKCDGTVYNIADYPELAAYFGQQFSMVNKFGGNGTTTFAVPDLRGEFLRGTGTNSHANNGNGAAVGTHQDSTQFPCFAVNKTNHKLGILGNTGGDINIYNQDGGVVKYSEGTRAWQMATATDQSTGLTYDNVTIRPTNTSVLYCIATKNIYMNPSLDYSTDEKVVGSWITGKPLYQRTFVGTIPSTSGESGDFATITNDASLIDNLTLVGGYMGSASLGFIPANAMGWDVWLLRTKIRNKITTDATSYLGATGYITIRYTKTTD